jgi:hypothetical protein
LLAPFIASKEWTVFETQTSKGQIVESPAEGYSRFAAYAKFFSSRNPLELVLIMCLKDNHDNLN